jgi:uncharacterized protein YjdB
MVTAVGAGTATITLTSSNPSFTTTKEFTVEHIQPSRMEIISSDEDSEIYEGDTCTLTVNFTPENTTMRDVEWVLRTPSDSTYVKLIPMGESCKVVGLKEAGRIYIRANSLGTYGRNAEYGIRINKKVLITELSFPNASISMVKGETKNIQLNITRGATENVIFTSSNEDVVTIDKESIHVSLRNISFDITAVGAGTATITATAEESGLTATCEVTVLSNNFYTITFVNEDGSILQSSQVREFEMPAYNGETPTKAATAEYTYTFEGWTPEIVPATADATYTATYHGTKRSYQIRFLNYDGTELQSSQVEYGAMPEYIGEIPTRSSDEFNYTFAGWAPEVVTVTSNASYTATYTEQRIMPVLSNDEVYHITQPYRNNTSWVVEEGGTQLRSNMQIGAENKSDDPRQQFAFLTFDDAETYYLYHVAEQKYISKEGELSADSVDPVYFKRGAYENTFIVYFDDDHYINVNDYGNLVIDYWNKPDGGNSCVITAVPKYVSTYYTVTFLDWDGTELHVEQVEQGHDAVGPAMNPTREGYVFIGWSKPITNITSDLIVIALYDKASSLDDVECEKYRVRKVIENNQLRIILPNGIKYSAAGQKIDSRY